MVEDTRKLGIVKVLMVKGQDGESTPIATTSVAGKVKPDGATITVEQDGTIKTKLPPSIDIDESFVKISPNQYFTMTVVVTGGQPTFTSSDISVATADVNSIGHIGDTWTVGLDVYGVADGVCSIEITIPETTKYYGAKFYINVLVGASSGGSSVSKTRYTISSSSWSASANASGYYTYSLTLNPTLVTTQPPNVSCAGSTDSTVPTAAQKTQYNLVDYYDNTAANTLVLYAKTKPSSTFYIWVEGNNA